ncbi:MAG: alpha/beta fold hydrolase [Acidobacteriota bacterium]
MRTETFDIPGPAGRLESILMLPDGLPIAAGVLCHPHPLHGGTMHYKAVYHAARAFQENGCAALRFNFRGVGRSAGRHDHGRGEQDDVRAALAGVEQRFAGLPIVLGGFSFGSVMALKVGVRDPHVKALLAMGLPLSAVPSTAFLADCTLPRLFIQGEFDQFGSLLDLQALVDRLPEPRSLEVVPGSDHFFTGHMDRLQRSVASWVRTHPWAQV